MKTTFTTIITTIFATITAFAQLHTGTFNSTLDFDGTNVVAGGTTIINNIDGTDVDISFSWDQDPPNLSGIYDNGTYSGLAGGSNFWYTATGLGNNAYTMCMNFSGENLTEVGFDITHINWPGFGGGDKVTISAETVGRNSIIPTYTQPSGVDYTLTGNVADAFAYETAPEYNLGVNLSASVTDPIAQVCITWEECSSCLVGDHGIGISDIGFNSTCTENPVVLTLNFDDYPE